MVWGLIRSSFLTVPSVCLLDYLSVTYYSYNVLSYSQYFRYYLSLQNKKEILKKAFSGCGFFGALGARPNKTADATAVVALKRDSCHSAVDGLQFEHVHPTKAASSPPQALLDDPHPTVRCIATLCVCKILAKCWELLPPVVIVDFLKKLAKDLANDTSSDEVRCSVFKVEGAVLLLALLRFKSLGGTWSDVARFCVFCLSLWRRRRLLTELETF